MSHVTRFEVSGRAQHHAVCPLPAVVFREASRHFYQGERLRYVDGCWLVLKDGTPLVSQRRWPRFSPRAPSYHPTIGFALLAHPPRGESWDDAIGKWEASRRVETISHEPP